MSNQSKYKDEVLRLHAEGKNNKQICDILGCGHNIPAYYLKPGEKQRNLERNRKIRQNAHPYHSKSAKFCCDWAMRNKQRLRDLPDSKNTIKYIVYHKLITFNHKEIPKMIEVEIIIQKLTENPKCYLTGRPIDITKSRSYEFDHILPKSRGGKNTLDNLGIASKDANKSKADLTIPEFLQLCQDVLQNFGYEVNKKPQENPTAL